MGIPIRVVFEEKEDSAYFYTAFDLRAMDQSGHLTEKGRSLYGLIASIPGVAEGESSVQFGKNHIWVSKIRAFKWNEIKPEVIRILKEFYGFSRIEVE